MQIWRQLPSKFTWAAYGAVFGVAFPIMAAAIRYFQMGVDGALDAVQQDPLLWIIATAPLFLGLFAWLGGRQNDRVRDFSKNLEQKVDEKTKELKASNQAIQTVMDHVSFGLLICDEKLNLKPGYSAACRSILGLSGEIQGRNLVDLLKLDERESDHFRSIYNQIFDPDFLIGDLSIDYLPTRFQIDAKAVGLTGSVVHDEQGRSKGVLFCLADVTNLARAEEEIERNRTLIKMISNRDSFRQFVLEAYESFRTVESELGRPGQSVDHTLVRRELHTLKGNCGSYGLSFVAQQIHRLEDETVITNDAVLNIEKGLAQFLEDHQGLLGMSYGQRVDEMLVVPAHVIQQAELRLRTANSDQLRDLLPIFSESYSLNQLRPFLVQSKTIS